MSDSNGQASPVSAERRNRRGMSMVFAIVILVVVILVVGAVGFLGLQSQKSTSTTQSSCTPSCPTSGATSDGTLFVPYSPGFNQTMTTIAAGLNISATVGVKGTEIIKSFNVNWGDGTNNTGLTPTFLHTYSNPGLYVISGSAVDTNGVTHTALDQLFPVNVTQSISASASGYYPALALTFNNGTSGKAIYPWVGAGATVTVNGSYLAPPADPFYHTEAPTITYSAGVSQKTSSSGPGYASGSYTFNNPGTYFITFRGNSTDGTTTQPFTYTWAVFVAASASGLGCPACSSPSAKSPHPGEYVAYEVQPGGPETVDPASDYYTVGYEVDINIFQTLIEYNGTDVGPTPNNYLPEIATCVPGSAQCASMYSGNNLVVNNEYYTFVISPTAKFYDPTTGKSWSVYPTDVFFSMLRTMSFADLPAAAVYPGWIEAQALVGTGNGLWDGGIHSPYNNTPGQMLNSMLVNNTTYCPSAALAPGQSGCLTFVVDGAGLKWPAFLSYLAVPSAGAVTPCSWYSYNGATVPGFMGTPGASQPLATDTGCLLPGGATTTSATSFKNFVAAQTPTSWDSYQGIAVPNYPSANPSVQWIAAGSGPYYLQSLNPGVSYVLKANPSYVQPAGCAHQAGCQPAPGTFVPSAVAYWESDDTESVQEYSSGYADFGQIEEAHASTELKLAADNLIKVNVVPTLATYDFGYDTDIDMATLGNYDPYTVNIQYNSLSFAGLRGFLTTAYPYASVQAEYNTIQGLTFGTNYGGFIPQYMGNYYPTNVSWPNYNVATGTFSNPSNDSSQVGSAAWYWSQLTDPSSGLYDPQFGTGGYSATNPLHVPALFDEGDPTHQAVLELWDSYVKSLSGGAVVLDIYPVSETIVYSLLLPNGQCPWALWYLTWFPDYAQPYDYWAAYGAASSTWAAPDAVALMFSQPADNSPSCNGYVAGGFNAMTTASFSGLAYWAGQAYIPQDCQGVAYNLTLYWAVQANHDTNIPEGQMYWNLVDAVYSHLNLYANTEQANYVYSFAPWIDPNSIGTNIVNGIPSVMYLFWQYSGNGVL